ncbi:MAG TPA: hypothetical protein VJS38_07970 [Phenylobacterium sp.]|uniref:hypothetical protein n=1 Tax=Phenylobacterium sp. TaxID=1871053 RepID=UPI002B49BE81|nr:hypothetical protein [Phenylobacterium sp.]HKR88099.1 hypothetical protein [Phenylobacterium sp.]
MLQAVTPSQRHARSSRISALRLLARAAVASYACFAGLNAQAAEPGAVSAAFGNTVISSYPDGTSQKIWLHADGTWNGVSRRNAPLAGKWTLRGDKVCMRQTAPPTLPISYCTPIPASSQPGAQWAGRDVAGRAITLSLMKGVPSQYQTAANGEASAAR